MLIKNILLATTVIILSIVETSKLGSEIGGLIGEESIASPQSSEPILPSLSSEESIQTSSEAMEFEQLIKEGNMQSIFETFRDGNDSRSGSER
jgi:hypothetical protein